MIRNKIFEVVCSLNELNFTKPEHNIHNISISVKSDAEEKILYFLVE